MMKFKRLVLEAKKSTLGYNYKMTARVKLQVMTDIIKQEDSDDDIVPEWEPQRIIEKREQLWGCGLYPDELSYIAYTACVNQLTTEDLTGELLKRRPEAATITKQMNALTQTLRAQRQPLPQQCYRNGVQEEGDDFTRSAERVSTSTKMDGISQVTSAELICELAKKASKLNRRVCERKWYLERLMKERDAYIDYRALGFREAVQSNAQRNGEHDDYDEAVLFQDSECGGDHDDDSSVATNECVWNSEDQPPKWMIEEAARAESKPLELCQETQCVKIKKCLLNHFYRDKKKQPLGPRLDTCCVDEVLLSYSSTCSPELCRGCNSGHPDAHCYFIAMTANLTFPAVMTRTERLHFFKKALILTKRPDQGYVYYSMPKCILKAIRENIVEVEDLTVVGGRGLVVSSETRLGGGEA